MQTRKLDLGAEPTLKNAPKTAERTRSLEAWIWDAAWSIRGARDASKYKDFILPLIITKRLCDVFDDEIDRLAKGSVKWLESHAAGAIMPSLSNTVLQQCPIALPDIYAQRQIADALDAAMERHSLAEARFSVRGSLFRTLLDELMTAMVRVDHLNHALIPAM